jgi:hypothetical protein
MEHAVRIDAERNELVVQLARHREYQAVLNDGVLRRSGKLPEAVTPRFGDPLLSLVVGQLGRCGACSVRVDANEIVQKSACVNLAERLLAGIICKLL